MVFETNGQDSSELKTRRRECYICLRPNLVKTLLDHFELDVGGNLAG